MFCTYLYKTRTSELSVLDPDQMRADAPTPEELEAKRGRFARKKFKGAGHRGRPQCRVGEMMWVDVTAPTDDDYALLRERFGLHAMVLEDVREHEGRPKLHSYGDYLYVVFFALSWKQVPADDDDPEHFKLDVHEIDCLIGSDYLITIHDTPLSPLDDLRNRWLLRPDMMRSGTGYLLYEIMDEVMDDYFPLLNAMDEHIDDFEERLFDAEDDKAFSGSNTLSTEIFALKRDLIQIRRIAGPTRDVVNILLRRDADTGGRNFAYYQDLYDHAARIVDQIDSFREMLTGALDAYLATESNRMNKVMKTLTACSIILLVPNLIAAIYGMNFNDMPIAHGFWGSLGVMAITIIALGVFFKRLNWL